MPLSPTTRTRALVGLGGALLVAIGAAGGAGAVAATRPAVEMAPAAPTAITRLAASTGIVTVRGKVAEVYGGQFVVQDATGRTMVDAGPAAARANFAPGAEVTVQGRYADGQLRASFLVEPNGQVDPVGHRGHGHHGRGGPEGPGRDGPGRDAPGRDGPPPPPACAPNVAAANSPAPPTAR